MRVFVYGAGQIAKKMYAHFKADKIPIEAFVVSDTYGNPMEIDGVSVIDIHKASIFKEDIVVIGVSQKYHDEVMGRISGRGFQCEIGENISDVVRLWRKDRFMSIAGNSCEEDADYKVESDYGYVGMKQTNRFGYVCHFRVLLDENIAMLDANKKINLLDEFERIYGTYNTVSAMKPAVKQEESSCRVLMACCHKDKPIENNVSDNYIVPIQAGRALTSKIVCEMADDTGNNISDRNDNYCECTALYWAWKNKWMADVDYIGLCHYRRKIDISENEVRSLGFNGIDIVLTAPTFVADKKNHIVKGTKNFQDWKVTKEMAVKLYPDYAEAFEIFENQYMIC